MKQSVTESKKEFIRGQFSSRNKDAPQAEEACGAEISVFAYLSRKDRNKFERMLEKRLAIIPRRIIRLPSSENYRLLGEDNTVAYS